MRVTAMIMTMSYIAFALRSSLLPGLHNATWRKTALIEDVKNEQWLQYNQSKVFNIVDLDIYS